MDISIIIPCYNSGLYLNDALQSIQNSEGITNIYYEVIIIDDGSTDELTKQFLGDLDPKSYIIIRQDNKGPGAARNTGVKIAKGDNILFLDADNKIRRSFITKGLSMLNSSNADVVYGKAVFFGDDSRQKFTTGKFNMEAMLVINYIDICTIMRKSVLTQLGGFDEDPRLIAFEDWEFWIRAGAAGYNFHFIDEVMFDYRISNQSLLAKKNEKENFEKVVDLIYEKHYRIILQTYRDIGFDYVVYRRDENTPFRTFFKYCYYKYIRRGLLGKKHKYY